MYHFIQQPYNNNLEEIFMEDMKLFQIGEVAKMFQISVGTLRHYEQSGLVIPEYTDPQTGYRYYSIRQFEVLNTIRYLRVLDMPLNQIADFLHNRDIQVIEDKLQKQKELIRKKQQELKAVEQKINHRLQSIKNATVAPLDKIQIIQAPATRIVWIRDSLKPTSYLDLEYSIRKLTGDQPESIVFLGKVGVGISKEQLEHEHFETYDCAFLVLDEEDIYQGTVDELPESKCVSVHFRGSHKEASGYYQKLLQYIHEQHLEITGTSREITLIDNGITSDPEKFVTEIRIPVA